MDILKAFTDPDYKKKYKGKFFGKYRAFVKDINDPEQLGRIKVECKSIYGNDLSPWCWPCFQYGGSKEEGIFFPPSEGSGVWIEFEQGFPDNPIWSGTWWTKLKGDNELPENARDDLYGKNKIIKTKSGHMIEIIDEEDNERIIITEGIKKSVIKMTKEHTKLFRPEQGDHIIEITEGNIKIINKEGNLNIDIEGNSTINVKDNAILNCKNAEINAEMTTVNGKVALASGGPPIARVGDEIQVTVIISGGSSAGSYTAKGYIMTGSDNATSG